MNTIRFCFITIIALFASIASAQVMYHPGSTAPHAPLVLCNGGYIPQGTPCGQGGGMNVPMVGIPNQPGMFRSGGNVYRCSATATWAGRLAGAAAGFLIGKNIRFEGSQMGPLGTVVGVIAGQEIACELAGRDQMVGIPGQQQGGAVQRGADGQVFTPGNMQSPSVCRIDGQKPILGYSESDCLALAERLTKSVPAVVQQKPQQLASVVQNPCADQADRIPVIRANGEPACRKIGSPAEPGEKPYPQ